MMEKSKSIVVSQKISKGDKYLPAEWLKKVLEACDSVRDKAYLMYHSHTGLRVSDVINTEIVHIDWQNNRTYTWDKKKDQWRFVHWPEPVRAPLKMWMKQRQNEEIKDKRLFPFSSKTANRIVKKWCEHVSFPYAKQVGSHWLRHTYIRLSRRAGRDLKHVQANTGDSVKTILNWYSDLSSEDIQKEMKEKPLI